MYTTEELKKMDYKKYLRTPYRLDIREKVKDRFWNKCNRCWNTELLHVHHHKYEHRWEWWKEIRDLELVCNMCHYNKHKGNTKQTCTINANFVKISVDVFNNGYILEKIYKLLDNCVDREYNQIIHTELKELYKKDSEWLKDFLREMESESIILSIEWDLYLNPLIANKWDSFSSWWRKAYLTDYFASDMIK